MEAKFFTLFCDAKRIVILIFLIKKHAEKWGN